MKKGIFLIWIMLLISFVFGCDKINKIFTPKAKNDTKITKAAAPKTAAQLAQEEVKGTMLAKVNDKVITLEEFEQYVKNLETAASQESKQDIKATIEEKKGLLDLMINQELMYQEAKIRGMDNKKEVKDMVDVYLRIILGEQLKTDTTENVVVDAQEIELFYNQNKDLFSEPEQRKVREIVVSSEDRAREILISLLQGGDFATIANEKSIGESKAKAGDVGLITRGQRGEDYKKYDDIVFSLGIGETSTPFKGPQGRYYIVKVEEIKEVKTKSLTDKEVWNQVKAYLSELKKNEKIKELITKLKSNATIEIKEELLK